MDYSPTAPISRETWAPRSPLRSGEDRYAERPPPPPQDVDMLERRDDFGGRDEPRFGGMDRGERRPPGPPPRPGNAPRAEPNNVLGVFGLSIRTRERDLEDEFSRYGDVEKVVIVYDQRTDRSRGFGFITMRTIEDATRAIDKLNGIELHGRAIRVDYSATQKPHAPTPGEYRGEKRPLDDRFAGRPRFDDRRGDRYGGDRYGGDRYGGDRYGGDRGGDRDFRRRDDGGSWGGGRPPVDRRDRDGPAPPRRDFDDPYGGRARRDDDREPRERPPFDDRAPRGDAFERRRSPSPRRRFSASPERRAPPPPPSDRF